MMSLLKVMASHYTQLTSVCEWIFTSTFLLPSQSFNFCSIVSPVLVLPKLLLRESTIAQLLHSARPFVSLFLFFSVFVALKIPFIYSATCPSEHVSIISILLCRAGIDPVLKIFYFIFCQACCYGNYV
jgi:hypothetical protein